MRKLQQFKIVLENGKQKSKEEVGESKKVIDSSAELLVLQSKSVLSNPNNAQGVKVLTVWEDLGEVKKVKETPKKDKKETK